MRTLAPPAKITFAGEPLNLHRRYIHPPAKTILPNKRKSLATTPTRCPIPLQSSALLPLLLRPPPPSAGSPPSTESGREGGRGVPPPPLADSPPPAGSGEREERELSFSIYRCCQPAPFLWLDLGGRGGAPPLPLPPAPPPSAAASQLPSSG